jgi:hypothetical protein
MREGMFSRNEVQDWSVRPLLGRQSCRIIFLPCVIEQMRISAGRISIKTHNHAYQPVQDIIPSSQYGRHIPQRFAIPRDTTKGRRHCRKQCDVLNFGNEFRTRGNKNCAEAGVATRSGRLCSVCIHRPLWTRLSSGTLQTEFRFEEHEMFIFHETLLLMRD